MRIGVYNRHWNTFGGGEKYIGSIAQYLTRLGTVDLIAHEPFSIPRLEKRLNLELAHCRSVILGENGNDAAEDLSREYDLWIDGTFQSSARSRAKKSILVVMFPFLGSKILRELWRTLPIIQPGWFQRIFWDSHGFWHDYDAVVALSSYTQHWIKRWWGVDSYILLPCADLVSCPPRQEKRRTIISVGRFFAGGHNKKHGVMIEAFKQLYDSGVCASWKYHLCGGSHPEAAHRAYLNDLIEQAKRYPIHLHPDIGRTELEELYRDASIFWHATGYGEREIREPERLEHFGITTVEAMAAGCIPVVIAKAGQKEIVSHGVSGYLWNTVDELKTLSARIVNDASISEKLREGAIRASATFSYEMFSEKLSGILERVL